MKGETPRHTRGGGGKRAAALADEIREDIINDGLGIVPVLGSGISAQSGIPAGNDYRAYLFYCVARLFGSDGAGNNADVWDPSRLRWPPYTTVPTYNDLSDQIRTWTQDQAQSLPKPPPQALWESLGAVADWRAMLHLLSRTRADEGDKPPVLLKEPDARIIDSFFVNLTEGKRPNTAHMLLAHLADVLRMRVILTTNFDTLLEAAFARLEMPVATFDVHYQAGLPDGRFTRAQRSIVKINGGRYGLRADFTLDTLPDARDFESFLSYLAPLPPGHAPPAATGPRGMGLTHQRNVLVMGVSGQERRTISLICNAMLELPGLKTYWICHRRAEIDRVYRAFSEVSSTLVARRRSPPPRSPVDLDCDLAVAATPDVGLFLLHLYQRIFLCLPPSGVPFKAVWPQPPPPYELARPDAQDCRDPRAASLLVDGTRKLEAAIKGNNRLVFVAGDSGVPSVAANAFLQTDDRRHRVWVDVEDDSTEEDLPITVLEAIRQQVGVGEPMFFRHEPGRPSAFDEQFERLRRFSRRPFLIFINGREAPGRHEENQTAANALIRLLDDLGRQETVTTILLGWNDHHWKPILEGRMPTRVDLESLRTPERRATVDMVWDHVQKLQGTAKTRLTKFIAALTLFRKPCYLSASNAWPFLPLSQDVVSKPNDGFIDKDELRSIHVQDCLRQLRMLRAIRDDNGQSVYMHRSVREGLKARLDDLLDCQWLVEAHQGIADWHLKLFRASGDVAAAFESLHHRICCIEAACKLPAKEGWPGSPEYLGESAAMEAYVTLVALRAFLPTAPQPETSLVRLGKECKRLRAREGTVSHVRLAVAEARRCQEELRARWRSPAEPLPVGRGDATPASAQSDPHELPRLDVLSTLPEIGAQIRDRRYEKAEAVIWEELDKLGIAPATLGPDAVGARLVRYDECRTGAQVWVTQTQFDQLALGRAVRVLHHYHTLRLLRAELHFRLGAEKTKMRDALMGAEAIYVFVTEVMRNIGDIRFLRSENAFFRANQGLVLSWMNRPREAHRRYNEAYGYLNQLETLPMSLRFAAIDARRTQTFLWNVRTLLKKKSPSKKEGRQAQGLLRDAIAAAERAAYKSFDLHYPAWHSYLAELAMEVCCEIAREGSAAEELYARSRDRSGYGEWFRSSFESGYFSVGQDPVRLRRYVELAECFLQYIDDACKPSAAENNCREEIAALLEKCARRLAEISDTSLEPDVRRYARRTQRRTV